MSDTLEPEVRELYRNNPDLAAANGYYIGRVDEAQPDKPTQKRHKYGAVATTVDGVTFASKAEARRYEKLKLLERTGRISNLELQPRYPLLVNGVKVATYVADFRYLDEDGRIVVEDVKGMKTDVYKLKAKLVEAIYGIKVREIK